MPNRLQRLVGNVKDSRKQQGVGGESSSHVGLAVSRLARATLSKMAL